MSRKITDLPDSIDPVVLIKEKVLTCPICGNRARNGIWYDEITMEADEFGKHHKFLRSNNKYIWKEKLDVKCEKCGCKWNTGLFPADHKMFEISIDGENNTILAAINTMTKNLGLDYRISTLSQEDLIELEDRFGEYVRFVVEDMLSGEGKRWNS